MYMKNLTHKMTLRLDDELDTFVKEMAERYRITPSDYIRQCVAQSLYGWQAAQSLVDEMRPAIKSATERGIENGIDRKTLEHNIV